VPVRMHPRNLVAFLRGILDLKRLVMINSNLLPYSEFFVFILFICKRVGGDNQIFFRRFQQQYLLLDRQSHEQH
jgi:hypothetical protein